MLYIDLSRLVGGKSYIIPCTLFCNKYQVLTFALTNSKVNAFTLINIKYIIKLANFLNAPLEELLKPIPIYRYNK